MKNIIAIIFVMLMICALAVPAAALVIEEDVYDVETGETTHGGGVIVDNPYAALYVEFFTDGKYPDDFAGLWVENGNYVFALVEGTDASKYEAVLGDYAGQYRFEYMPYSYNMLIHMRDEVFKRLKDIMSGAGVHQIENKIFFDVWVDEEEENGMVAQSMLDVKNEEGLPDGIENAFTVSYGVFVEEDEEVEAAEAIDGPAPDDDYDWAAQNRAIEAAGALMGSVYDEDGNILRGDYAGAWYDRDNKRLVVAVTEDGDMDFYRELFKDYDNVDFTTLKYPLKALRTLQHEVFERLFDIMSSAGAMEMENLVAFEVGIDADEARPLILKAMTDVKNEYNLPDGIESAFTVEYGIMIPAAESEAGAETGNPNTGLALSAVPMIAALAVLSISKKRR